MTKIHTVDPARLAWGKWDAAQQKDVGEGDIHKAYSGDTIASGKIRGVVTIEGQPYTVVGLSRNEAHLWPLLTLAQWEGKPTMTYGERTRRGQKAEFTYEAITVKRGKDVFVMGPRCDEISVQGAKAKADDEPAPEPEPDDAPDDDDGDDVCDLCSASGVHVDRTTYCGKTIGIECGCEEANETGKCPKPDCEECAAGALHDDDGDGDEPEPVLTLAPTEPIPAQQMTLFASEE